MKWEYKVVSRPKEVDLNNLGDAGWEVVGVVCGATNIKFDVILKRPKPDLPLAV